jgi:S-formylglutathione hydrolase
MNLETLKTNKCFNGSSKTFEHDSSITKTKMKFGAFLPNEENQFETCIIWLSGLTCNEDNFITKAGAQQFLKDTKTMIVCPDTSPRGLDLPGEHESYDFGSGAGFYLSATTEGYKDHYKMDQYITDELVLILKESFGVKRFSIMGHSMGGHGALTLGLKNPDLFKSVSAFSPMVNPSASPWGRKALTGYLGSDEETWKQYDATELIKTGVKRPDTLLIDQGLNDEFFEKELVTKNLEKAAEAASQALEVKYREGYDHSYFYISTFIEEHIEFHLKALT